MQAIERRTPHLPAIPSYELPIELRVAMQLRFRRSRADWKALQLDMLPPYCELTLAFDWDASWVDSWSGRRLYPRSECAEIIADQFTYRKSLDGERRAKLAKRIRRRWCDLVDHAIGYHLAGNDVDVFEFADR